MKTGLKTIRLRSGRERSVKRFHPWVYSGAIENAESGIEEGELVEVLDANGSFLACGFFAASSIAVKVFSFKKVAPDYSYWKGRLAQAKKFREQLSLTPQSNTTNAFRLVNAEGDGLPGLIIDIYGAIAVIQCHSLGAFKLLEVWQQALIELYGESLQAIYSKSAETLKSEDGQASIAENGLLHGSLSSTVIQENSLSFLVNVEEGQKTGFFIDQRDNRAIVREISSGKKVLNLFSYSGGFSIAALIGGASHVTSVDVSAPALGLLEKNLSQNDIAPERSAIVESDCFKYLENVMERFDLIIVDPPPFAKSRTSIERALQGYKALNNLALKRLEREGTVLTFSCSQVVGSDVFTQAVADAGIETGRQLRIRRELSSPACHPVSLYHPEGDYLKGLYLVSEN